MAEDKQLTVAELLARARKDNPDAAAPKRRRRRSLEDGGISVAELTGSFPAVTDAPPEAKHTAVSIDGDEKLTSTPEKDPKPAPAKPAAAKPAPAAEKKPAPTKPAPKKPEAAATPTAKPTEAEAKKPTAKPTEAEAKKPTAKPTEAEAKKPTAKPAPAAEKKPAPKKPEAKPAPTAKPTEAETKKPAAKPATAKAPAATAATGAKKAEKTSVEKPAAAKPAVGADDDAKTGVLKKVDAEPKRAAVAGPAAKPTPGVAETGVIPAVAEPTATTGSTGGSTRLAERPHADVEEAAEEESGTNAVAVIGMAVVGVVLGAVVFIVFQMLWGALNPWLTGILALLVTAGMILAVRAMRTTRDGMTMALAGLVGLVTTFGPALIVLL